MNILVVLFFSSFDAFMRNRGAADLRHYLREVRVDESSPVASHLALVVGRHNGRGKSWPLDKETIHKVIPTSYTFHACGIVTLTGEAFNDVDCFKPANVSLGLARDSFKAAAIAHLDNLPPIYTGDLIDLTFSSLEKAPEHVRAGGR